MCEPPSQARVPPALIRCCSSQERAKLCWAKLGLVLKGGLILCCCGDHKSYIDFWSIAAHWITAWGDGQNHLLSHFILCTQRGCLCFLRARASAQLNPKAGKEREDFALSSHQLVPGTGQGPISSSLQLWTVWRISWDHTLFVLMADVQWIILQSDVLAPCPVPPLSD